MKTFTHEGVTHLFTTYTSYTMSEIGYDLPPLGNVTGILGDTGVTLAACGLRVLKEMPMNLQGDGHVWRAPEVDCTDCNTLLTLDALMGVDPTPS